MMQLAPAAMLVPQLLLWAKLVAFVPVIEIPVMVSAALPVLDKVTGFAALVVPTVWFANANEVGDKPATGEPPPLPNVA